MDRKSDCESIANEREETKDDGQSDFEGDLSMSVARRINVTRIVARHSVAWARYSLGKFPVKMTLGNLGVLSVMLAIALPRYVTYLLVYPIFRLVFGTLYPAYASYKAVRTKNVKEYVKWMMYWIVFALFTCAETFTDVFFSFWFPFYYEIKIILVLWLLSPATKGSSILYRRFVHPALSRREAEIDEALARATEQGYTAVLHLGTKGVNYATTVLMQTAIKNLPNVVPSTLNVSPASQSDSALSSSGNHKAGSSPSRKDSHDGAETPSRRSVTPKRRVKPADTSFGLEPDVHEVTTDENSDCEFQELEYDEQFKAPKEKARKSKREHAEATRKQKPRACKELKGYEMDFSDEVDCNY